MRSREWLAALVLACAGGFGCATAPTAPPDWLPTAEEVQGSPYGAWIEIGWKSPRGMLRADGELIAIQGDRVYVLQDSTLVSVPADSVNKAKLTWYDAQAGSVAGAAVLGTIATLSNGFYLVFTAPMWIIGGAAATGSRSRDPVIATPEAAWSDFVPYARFPQGMPPGFAPGVYEQPVARPDTVVTARGDAPPDTLVSAPEPPPSYAIDDGRTQWGFCAGLGVLRSDEQSGLGGVLGLNLSKRWFTSGVRFSVGDRDAPNPVFDEGAILDLGLLAGVRTRFRALQLAVRAGPAAWGVSVEDLAELEMSLAVQGELVVYPWSNVGIGAIVAYNANDFQNFYVATLGIAIGPR